MNARDLVGKGFKAATAGTVGLWVVGIISFATVVLVCLTVWRVVSLSNDLSKSQSEASAAIAANKLWESDAAQAKLDLASCQSHWSDTSARGVEAVTQAKAGSAKAATDFQFWMRSWDLRGDTCAASLIAMEDACASSLSHY